MTLMHPLSIAVPLFFFLNTFTATGSNPTNFRDDVSINCGSIGTSKAAHSDKEWIGDVLTKSSCTVQIKGSSTTSTATHRSFSSDPVPYKTARISQSQFSYAFQVSPGQKILRLHFNPTTYKGFKGFKDLFTVEAGPFTLLGNFSASLTAGALAVDSFTKEFCLNIQENQQLNIIFSPESSQSLDTYAFINGIEIFSVPASLSYFQDGDIGLQLVGEKSPVYVDYNTALEIIHRIEIKQNDVLPPRGSDDMFPKWANQNAKKRNNNTWKMPVDVGFKYLIRVHFSELGLKIARNGDLMFKVLINEMTAHTNIDLVKERDENNIPWYRDYMVMVRGNKKEGKRRILISLQSYDDLIEGHALYSGFEVFKLSNYENSLASPNHMPPSQGSPSHIIQTLSSILCHRNVIANVAIAIISLGCIIAHQLREIREANITDEQYKPKPKPSARAERFCRRFSLDEIQLATKNFSDTLLIGRGGFGKVYKGDIDRRQFTVAIKRLKSSSKQGAREFLTEIETLSEVRHVNLVSLIGYCNEQGEMILVYEFMPHGTLADHLYKLSRENNTCSSLTWKQRLEICIGAGRGLDYLHTGHGVIHRDVKASNILLDENFIAKVSDFGLAKPENKSKLQTHISTNVKGTFGYLDPNYFSTRKLTRKSDTYAFGVVLLEVLCGRPAVDLMVAEDERVLSMWARDKINKGEADQIVATRLRDEISPSSLKTFVGVAQRCLSDEPKERPTMSQIVSQLELAVEQQETKQTLEVAAASVSDDYRCRSREDDLSVQTVRQRTISSTDVQNLSPPPKEQTVETVVRAQLPSTGTKHGRSAARRKVALRWPWESFWKRSKPLEENDLSLSEKSRTPSTKSCPKQGGESKQNQVAYSPRVSQSNATSASPRKPTACSRFPMEPAPWSQQDSSKKSSPSRRATTNTPHNSPSVYEEIEKSITELEFETSGKDLRLLKQILESMNTTMQLQNQRGESAEFTSQSRTRPDEDNDLSLSEESRTPSTKSCPNEGGESKQNQVAYSPRVSQSNATSASPRKPTACSRFPMEPAPWSQQDSPKKSSPSRRPSVYGEIDKRLMENQRGESAEFTLQRRTRSEASPSAVLNKPAKLMDKVKLPIPTWIPGMESSHLPRLQTRNPKYHSANLAYRQKTKDLTPKRSSRNEPNFQHLPLADKKSTLRIGELDRTLAGPQCTKVDNCTTPARNFGMISVSTTSEDMPAVKIAVAILEEPSPISVLDDTIYSVDSPSPVKKISSAFRGDQSPNPNEAEWHLANLNHLTDCTRSNHGSKNKLKLETAKNFGNELTLLDNEPDETSADQNTLGQGSLNPNHRYINTILLTSGLLKDPTFLSTSDKLLSSSHLINPDMFHALEQREETIVEGTNQEVVGKNNKMKSNNKIQRKIVFDMVDEILVRRITSGRLFTMVKKRASPQGLLKEVYSEIDRLCTIPDCNLDNSEDEMIRQLNADIKYESEDWKDYRGELPALVLDIERLIFKDMINEVVTGEVMGVHDWPEALQEAL